MGGQGIMGILNQGYPTRGYPGSKAELERADGGRGPLYHFLKRLAYHDVVFLFDDFNNKDLNTVNDWTIDAGLTAEPWVRQSRVNGTIRGSTGTTAASSGLQLIADSVDFYGDYNAGLEVRYRASVITELRLELGMVDVASAVNTPMVNSLSTPTFTGVTGGGLYVYNHTGSTTTTGLYTIGSDVSAAKVATTTNRPVAATYQTVRMQFVQDFVHLWVDGQKLAESTATQMHQGGDALQFVFNVKNNSTTNQDIDIDYVALWYDRQ